MIAALFEWIVVGGAGWVVVEGASVMPGDRSSPAHRCVPVGGRTARYCAEGVLRQHRADEIARPPEVITIRVRAVRGPLRRFKAWRAFRRARRYVFVTGSPDRCTAGMEPWQPIEAAP